MSERSSRSALLSGKCPVCRRGDIFKYGAFRIAHFSEMNLTCPECASSFEPEPGFYFGAMYITYAFNIFLLIGSGLVMYYLVALSEPVALILIAVLAVIITPFSFRASRILWLYWFGGLHYDPNK
jgi:hypothetical protein